MGDFWWGFVGGLMVCLAIGWALYFFFRGMGRE